MFAKLNIDHKESLTACILGSKDEAIRFERNVITTAKLFSDGSARNGHVGAAAILRRDGRDKKLSVYLGPETERTVYEAEVVGMTLAVHLLENEDLPRAARIYMGVDNQAALRAPNKARPGPGHAMIEMLQERLRAARAKHRRLDLNSHWIPAHVRVEGNEIVDGDAKLAAEGLCSHPDELPAALCARLPASASATKRTYIAELTKSALKEWKRSPRFARIVEIDSLMRTPKKQYFLKLVGKLGLTKAQTSLLMQLRTGHAPLNKHLSRIGKAESPLCSACNEKDETVWHFILECEAYEAHRNVLRAVDARQSRMLTHLLSSARMIPHLLHYVASTSRLQATFGNVSPLE